MRAGLPVVMTVAVAEAILTPVVVIVIPPAIRIPVPIPPTVVIPIDSTK